MQIIHLVRLPHLEPFRVFPKIALLENFNPIEITTERALENRVADIEIRTNDLVDETDSQANINNGVIEAFTTTDNDLQQAVDISA